MALAYYRALIMQDECDTPADGYAVVFPDLPGCTSAGDTAMDAAKQAAEALAGHIAAMTDAREALPKPSDIGSLPDWLENAGRIAVEVLVPVEMPGRAVRANITVDEGLLHRIDIAAQAMGNTRSGFLAEAARAMLRSDHYVQTLSHPDDLKKPNLYEAGALPSDVQRGIHKRESRRSVARVIKGLTSDDTHSR